MHPAGFSRLERSLIAMPAALPLKQPVKVSQLVRRRLRELKRTPRELAEAVRVSEQYISDLVAGRRRPPAPGRSDLYVPMAKFLRLHRNDLPTCARVERAREVVGRRRPDVRAWKLMLALGEPARQRFFVSSRRRHTRLTCDWSSDVCSSD